MFKKSKPVSFFPLAVFFICISIADAEIWVAPNSFDVNVNEGCVQTDTLTIGNNGAGTVNFTLRSREVSPGTSGGLSDGGAVVSKAKTAQNSIVLEYEFSSPVIGKAAGYDTVQIKGLKAYEQTGAPIIPLRPATILIPFGKKVVNTRVVALNKSELPGTYQLPPAQKPYPLSYTGIREQTRPDSAIYGKKTPWPGKDHEKIGAYSKRGYQLLVLNLFPVQYEPTSGRITYATRMRVEIELADSAEKNIVKPAEHTKSVLKRKVDNPGVLASYTDKEASVETLGGEMTLPGGGPYQYVIITSPALQGAPGPYNFQALRDAKIARGVSATIVTTEWIYANYDGAKPSGGSDNQTQIRNFLIDAYQNWGTQYVLLGGTNAIVPARMFWVDSLAGEMDYMPVDMYYGCVDPPSCTFDYDADNKYGEPTDGPGGGEVDLFAEIYVGRAPVENATEIANFVRKTLSYDTTQGEYLPRIVMVGEYLGFGGPADYATDSMEQIRTGGTFDGYYTCGFEGHKQQNFIDFNTIGNIPGDPTCAWPLYDTPDYDWPNGELTCLMNNGVHCINHLGHANYTYCMKLNASELSSLTNTDYFFVYSQGCDSGGFDETNCFAEVLTTVEHGAYGAIMNARYGWGAGNSTDGPSQRFARQFWDAPLGEDKLEIGRANQDSKEDNIWGLSGACIRWCYYELNLFGDPQQAFRFEEVCKWINLEPNEGTIGPGASIDIDVTFDAMNLSPGVYGAEIVVQSNDPCGSATVPVTMTVSADALQVSPAGGFDSNGSKGGPFEPAYKKYTLTNIGGSTIVWTARKSSNWLRVWPPIGVLRSGSSVDVNVCINANANLLDPNLYMDTVTFRNVRSGSIKQRNVSLAVKPPDLFTETFSSSGYFLNLSLTFRPNGSSACYEACRDEMNAFPVDPNGGTYLSLGDDDFAEVVLSDGKEVLFYGQSYDRFYVGSNGYITFGSGDTEYEGSLENHFSLPRISGCFTDLTPANSQNISFKQMEDRAVVTFLDVPVFGDKTTKNSFQIEMFFNDGAIRMTWLKLDSGAGVAGLSEGKGLPPVLFEESNFRAYPICWPLGDFNKDYTVDLADLGLFVSYWLNDDCNYPLWCDRTDLDFSSDVEGVDFSIFAENWGVTKSTMPLPVAWWKFDEMSGTIAYDSAGNNDGNLVNGPTWTTGLINGGLSFDGVNDYVDVPDDPSLKFTQNDKFSLCAWLNPISGYGNILSKMQTSGKKNLFTYEFRCAADSQQIVMEICQSGVHYVDILTPTGSAPAGSWSHVVCIYENRDMRIYVNGELEASGYFPYETGTNTSDQHMGIGARLVGSEIELYFRGTLDDVRIYNRALSAEEVEQLYLDGLSKKASNPNPADGEDGVDPNVELIWSLGKDAVSHDVYFGTDFNEVNEADIYDPNVYMGNQDVNYWDANNYDSNGLEPDTMFFWRIDEVSPAFTIKGDVWRFRTVPAGFDPNLVSWWMFDEGTGTIAHDSADSRNGTVYGATWTTGQIDGALSFDGVNDYVGLPNNNPVWLPQNDFTASVWVNFDADPVSGENEYILDLDFTWYANHASCTGITLFRNASDSKAAFFIETTNTTDALSSNDIFMKNRWYQVVVVRQGTTQAIYLDGSINASRSCSGDPIKYSGSCNDDKVNIGRYSEACWTNPPYYLDGMIDDVRIYDRALSAEEIWQLYQSGL